MRYASWRGKIESNPKELAGCSVWVENSDCSRHSVVTRHEWKRNEQTWAEMTRHAKTWTNEISWSLGLLALLGSSWLFLALRSWAPGAEVAAPMASPSQGLRRTAGSSPKLRIWKNGTRKTRKTSKSCGPTFLNSLKSLKIFKSNATRPRTLRRRFKFFCKAASLFQQDQDRQTNNGLLHLVSSSWKWLKIWHL